MRHLLKPNQKQTRMTRLVTTRFTKRPTSPKPSGKPYGAIYETVRTGLDIAGIYDEYDLSQYDPQYYYDKYVKKYTYKPRKRLTGYALQTKGFLREKIHANRSYGFQQEQRESTSGWYSRSNANFRHSRYSGFCDACSCRRCAKRLHNKSSMVRTMGPRFSRRSSGNYNSVRSLYYKKSWSEPDTTSSWNPGYL